MDAELRLAKQRMSRWVYSQLHRYEELAALNLTTKSAEILAACRVLPLEKLNHPMCEIGLIGVCEAASVHNCWNADAWAAGVNAVIRNAITD